MKYSIIITILFLCGCSVTKQTNRLILNHPIETEIAFRKSFPCVPIQGEIKIDSSSYKSLLDTLNAMEEYYQDIIRNINTDTALLPIEIHDTAISKNDCSKLINKLKIKLKSSTEQSKSLRFIIDNFKPIVKTVYVNDTSKDDTIKELQKKNSDILLDSSKKDKWKWWCLATWAIITLYIAFRIYLKFK